MGKNGTDTGLEWRGQQASLYPIGSMKGMV